MSVCFILQPQPGTANAPSSPASASCPALDSLGVPHFALLPCVLSHRRGVLAMLHARANEATNCHMRGGTCVTFGQPSQPISDLPCAAHS
jgi:hypothetical protein